MSFIVETKFKIQTAQDVLLYRSTRSNVLNYIDIKINGGSASLIVEESYNYPGQYEVRYAFPNKGTYNITYEFPGEDWIKFIDCTSLSEVILPQGVTTIQSGAFMNSGLSSITIPDGVTTIGTGAFENSYLKSVHIPASVTSIAVGAGGSFVETGWLESITVDPANPVYDSRDNSNCIIKGSEIVVGSINCTIPTSVTGIGDYAFYEHHQLKSFSIPDNITYIGDYAFYNCWQLKGKLSIGSGLRSIGEYAFGKCYHIHKITISAVEPPSCYDSSFYMLGESLPAQQGYLYVPEESIASYKSSWTYLVNTLGWIVGEVLHYLEKITLDAAILGESFEIGPYESDSWYISSYPDWVHPSTTSNTGIISFNLDVDGNISESSRTGVVTVIYDSTYSANITVNQNPIVVEWDEKPLDDLRNDGGSWNGLLRYNLKPYQVIDWTDDWLNGHWSDFDEYLHIYGNVDPVGGIVNRTGNIDLTLVYQTYNGETINIPVNNTVSQQGEEYTYYPEVTVVAPEGGLVMTTVTSQYPLTGYKSAVSSVADVTFNRVSDTEITLYASYPMAEQGVMDTIMLVGDEGFENIPLTTVTQSKFELVWEFNQDTTLLSTDSTPESPLIDYVFGVVQYESSIDITDMTFTIDYLNGDDWITEITCDTDWQEVHIKAEDNRLGTLRRATITARTEQYDAAREFEVVQQGSSLYVYPTSGIVGNDGGSITFGVNDRNVGWIGPDEIAITLDGENVPFTYRQHSRTLEVTIQVPANDTGYIRTLIYDIEILPTNPKEVLHYTVTQSAFVWNIIDSVWFDSTLTTPTSPTAIITGQIDYTSTYDLGTLEISFDADWIRSTGQNWNNGNGIINVTIDDNRLGSLRRCTMTVYSPTYNKTKTVIIVQQGFSMSNQNSGYTIDCAGGDVTLFASCNSWIGQDEISIKGQINGSLVDLPFTINGGYITKNDTNVYVTIPPNAGLAREIEIQMHIRALGNYFIFNVDQPSCDINIDTPEIHFEQKGGSREVYIEANGDWMIEVVGDWITVTPTNGTGEDVIEISVDPNNTLADRTGYVYITNGVDREAIVITQGHIIPELRLKERYIKMPLEGGTTYVTLISNIDWTTEWEIQ